MNVITPRSEAAYRGSLGQTRKQQVHWACSECGVRSSSELYSAVDLSSDPALREPASRLALNRLSCPACGSETVAVQPVIFHDPQSELFALWIPESLAHQELQLRACLLQDLAADPAPLAHYIARPDVLIGATALARWLSDTPSTEVCCPAAATKLDVALAEEELRRGREELAEQGRELACHLRQLDEQRQILRDQVYALAGSLKPGEPAPAAGRQGQQAAQPAESSPLAAAPDHELDAWRASDKQQALLRHAGHVFLLAKAAPQLVAALTDSSPALLVQLRELPNGPLVMLILVPAAERLLPDADRALYWFLDPGAAETETLLSQLAADFTLRVGLFDEEARPAASFSLQAPLAENVALIQTRLEELMSRQAAGALGFADAVASYQASGQARLGRGQGQPLPPSGQEPLDSCFQVLRATSMLSYWARPEQLDQLLLILSFPLSRWRELERRVVREALAWGLPLGPDLGQAALVLGLAESWRALVTLCVERFAGARWRSARYDLTFAEEARVWQQLCASCAQHGIVLEAETRALIELADGRAGVFAAEASVAADLATCDEATLLAQLGDPLLRRDAALELCAREATYLGERIFAAACQMSVPEVFRVMPALASLRELPARLFFGGLQHRKAFVRQACLLALGVQKPPGDLHPLVSLLLEEPTPLWREAARVLGERGDEAQQALLERLDGCGPVSRERIAAALAQLVLGKANPAGAAAALTEGPAASVAPRVQQLVAELRLTLEHPAAAESGERSRLQELTAQFQRGLAAEVKELGEGDIVEQEEVLDASDIVDEEVQVVEEDILDPPGE